MERTPVRHHLFIVVLMSLCSVPCFSQDDPPRPPQTPPIAVNGDVELTEVGVTRRTVGYAAPEVLLSDLRLLFWLPVSKEPVADASYAIHLLSLDVIEDSKGTQLLTEKRREWIRELSGFRPCPAVISHYERQGPQFDIMLNVPSREAATIKRIKGTVEVVRTEWEIISFEKIGEQLNKPLKHPKLGDFVITPIDIRMQKDRVVCRLRVPKEHSLLDDWTLMRNREPLRPFSLTGEASTVPETVVQIREFVGDSIDDLSLYIRFAVQSKPKKLNFDFRDIPLP